MAHTFLRECTILLYFKGRGYRFDAFSNFQFSQTYSTTTTLRKTLHSKNSKPVSITSERNPASFSIEVLATNSYTEGVFYEIVGLDRQGLTNKYVLPTELPISPHFCELYVVNSENSFKVSKAIIQSVDVTFSIDQPLTFNVTFTAADIDRAHSLPLASGLAEQGDPLGVSPTQLLIDNSIHNNVITVGTSFQQGTEWRDDRTLHTIGSIYSPSKATITDFAVSSTITTTLNNENNTSDLPFASNIKIQKAGLLFSIDNARIIKRFTPGQVFQEDFDVSLAEHSNNIFVEYGGLLI
jgi:hypothetical protein